MWQILDGPLGQELLQALAAKPLKGVDIWSSGFKHVTTSKKPIRALADFTGLKMRVIPSQLLSAQYEAWGASPHRRQPACSTMSSYHKIRLHEAGY